MYHHVKKQTLHVTLDSESLALALQPRLQELNRATFLTIIERVFDELSFPDHHIFIARLDIDLGTVSTIDLDYEAGARFERKLREALQLAITRVERQPSPEERVQPDEHAQLEVLERYLLTGTLPFWVPSSSFTLEEWIAQLSTTLPGGLVDLIRRRRSDARVIQRLAHQLGEESAQRLLRTLSPSDDEWARELYRSDRQAFLALLRDSRERLAGERLLSGLNRADLDDLVRLIAPEQADRMVADLAELAHTQGGDRAEQSMRSIILDLAADLRRDVVRSPAQVPARAQIPLPPQEVDEELLQDLHRSNRPVFVALIRRLGRRPVMQRFLLRLGHSALEDLVRQLAPQHADQIAADVAELAGMPYFQRRTDPDQALRHLWLVATDVHLRTLDRPYDRRAFVRAVLAAFAESDGQIAHDVFTAITRDLTIHPGVESRAGPGIMSLQSLLAEMAADRSFEPRPAVEADELRRGGGSIFARYDRIDAVQYYVRHGVLPYSISLLRPGLTVADALDVLPKLPLSTLQAALADLDLGARRRAWRRVVQDLPHDRLTHLIDAMIEQSGLPAARTRSHLSTQVATTADPSLVYAEFIVRLLEEKRTDDASEPAPEISVQEHEGGSAWEAPRIKAVLASRARGTAQAGTERRRQASQEPTSLRLLLALIELEVEGARQFVRALKEAGVAPSVMVDEPPSQDAVHTIQMLLTPEAASGLTLLLESVAALAPADRPADEVVYAVVATEILEQIIASRPVEAFLDSVLRQFSEPGSAGPLEKFPDVRGVRLQADRREVRLKPDTTYDADREVRLKPDTTYYTESKTALERTSAQTPAQPRAQMPTPEQAPAQPSDQTQAKTKEKSGRAVPAPEAAAPQGWLKRLGGIEEDANRHALLRAIDDTPEVVHVALVERIGDQAIRERWAQELSEPELVRMAYVLEPRLHRVLMDAAELLFSAWLGVAPARGHSQTRRSSFWSFVFGFLVATRTSGRSLDRLVAYFFDVFGAAQHDAPTAGVESEATAAQEFERLLDAAVERASAVGSAGVRAILDRDRPVLIARRGAPSLPSSSDSDRTLPAISQSDVAKKLAMPPQRPSSRMAYSMDEEGAAVDAGAEPIYIANAGLVLANPFLPQWGRALDLLETTDAGKTRVRPDLMSRAVHLLQWLVNGSAATPEPLLCLNKLLCGASLVTPVERRIEPTESEVEICQLLLRSMLANWTIISTTSIEGLQETFLRREGRLERTSDGWRLTVQRKTVDVLVDQVPWSISTIVHPWMPEPISVTW